MMPRIKNELERDKWRSCQSEARSRTHKSEEQEQPSSAVDEGSEQEDVRGKKLAVPSAPELSEELQRIRGTEVVEEEAGDCTSELLVATPGAKQLTERIDPVVSGD